MQLGSIFGSYRLLQQIGEGGMGRVFVAEHTRLGRHVALKMLRSEFAGNVEAVKRFFAEARAVNRINHENIIEVNDFVENDQGSSYYIMELLQGTDLASLEKSEGVLPLARALDIGAQICSGVAAAHAAGIIHRDLKPDNVFLIERGGRKDFVKLLDFGIAKLTNSNLEDISTFKTNAGIVVGTPDYMSPEQASGKRVDQGADIYSLGVILFEMVTGERPFRAESFGELMVQHITARPPRPSTIRRVQHSLPSALEELILSCLSKDPKQRPQSMLEIERRLRDIALALSSPGGAPMVRRRSRRVWLLATLAALSAAAAGAAWYVRQANVRLGRAAARIALSPGPVVTPAPSVPQPPAPPSPPAAAATPAAPEPEPHVAPAPTTEPNPPARPKRRHTRLDRGGVLNPFE